MAVLAASIKLPIFVDCVEFSPFPNPDSLLACGLYQLQTLDDHEPKANQIRTGGVEILRLSDSCNHSSISFQEFASFRIDTAGILALRWITQEKLICACSDSQLRFLTLNHSDGVLNCENSLSILQEQNNLLLNVELDPTRSSFLIGHSTGHVSLGLSDQPRQLETWSAHGQSEVWCVDFHRGDANLLFSGADDGLLKAWDRRTVSSESTSLYSLRHEAGVISIFSTLNSEKVWTGSYDDRLRLWDLRNRKSPLYSRSLGGGVWRIRPKGQHLLCACMYNGWCVVECAGDAQSGAGNASDDAIFVKFSDNSCGTALLYGIDWVPGKNSVVCGTFYDSTVRLYDVECMP